MSTVLPIPTAEMLIDTVDTRDVPIGVIKRSDVLSQAKNFHTAHLFLFESTGRLLLQQLSGTRERHAFRWGASVAGYLFANETYSEAIIRRTRQELGVTVDPILIGTIAVDEAHATKFVSLFKAIHDGDVSYDRQHIADVKYMSLDEISADLTTDPDRFTPTFVRLFRFYNEQRHP